MKQAHVPLIALVATVLGCDEPVAAVAPSAAHAAIEPDQPAYLVETADLEGPVGEEAYLLVSVRALEGYHINLSYPQSLTVDAAPGLDLPLPSLKLSDAQIDAQERMSFTVPVVPTEAGRHEVTGTLKLGMCSEAACKTARESIRAFVTAQ